MISLNNQTSSIVNMDEVSSIVALSMLSLAASLYFAFLMLMHNGPSSSNLSLKHPNSFLCQEDRSRKACYSFTASA
jgi:hypothetical protein